MALKHSKLLFYFLISFFVNLSIYTIICLLYLKYQNVCPPSLTSVIMLLPACSVMIAKLWENGKQTNGRIFYIFYLITTFALFLIHIFNLVMPIVNFEVLCAIVFALCSIVSLGLIFNLSSKERNAIGLCPNINIKTSLYCIILFIVLFILMARLQFLSDFFKTRNVQQLKIPIASWEKLPALLINYFFAFSTYLGEEYGWRYFLQPLFAQKWGLRKAILLVSLFSVVFHIPVNFLCQQMPLYLFFPRIVINVSLAVFFGWAYVKTQNIFTATFIHFLNNSLGQLWRITDKNLTFSTPLSWIFFAAVFLPFIFSKSLKTDNKLSISSKGGD